jgi:phage terminase small subunit
MRRFAEAIAAGKRPGEAALIVHPQSRALKQIPKVAGAIAELEAMAMEEAGITTMGVLLRMNEVAQRCMEAAQVTDRKGNPIEGLYVFDAAGASRALENLAKYGLRIAERTEITGKDGAPLQTVNLTTTDPIKAAKFYQQMLDHGSAE